MFIEFPRASLVNEVNQADRTIAIFYCCNFGIFLNYPFALVIHFDVGISGVGNVSFSSLPC